MQPYKYMAMNKPSGIAQYISFNPVPTFLINNMVCMTLYDNGMHSTTKEEMNNGTKISINNNNEKYNQILSLHKMM